MEIGGLGDGALVLEKHTASLCDSGIQIVDCVEVFVDERLINQRPKVLGGLEFRAVGRLIDQAQAVGNGQVFRPVPASVVEGEDDDALASGAGRAREGLEQFGKERLVDAVGEVPDGLSARRRDESGDVKPFVAVMAERDRPLADGSPDAAMDRLQAEPMLIRRPYLDRLVGMLLGFLREGVSQLFLKAAVCSGVAAFGCRGRGDWIDQPIACRASHPRCGASFASPS